MRVFVFGPMTDSQPEKPLTAPEDYRLPPWSPILLAVGIFALAFAARWPSSGESFWVDELHSAWTVADGWSDVAARARLGNQNPTYFQALWLWVHLPWGNLHEVYPIETLWRLSSILATSVAAAWASILVQSVTRQTIAGVATGLAMAIQADAIFYGTELRPYSIVMLLSVAAASTAWHAINDNSSLRSWWVLLSIVGLSILCHITSILTLGCLLLAVAWSQRNSLPRMWSAIVVIAFLAWQISDVRTVWENRQQWQSFGRVDSIGEILDHWPWFSLLVAPFIAAVLAHYASGHSGASGHPGSQRMKMISSTWWSCLVMAMLAGTIAQWMLASTETAFIWHRRYNVAVLPLIAISFGVIVGSIAQNRSMLQGGTIATLCLASLMAQHPHAKDLQRGNLRLVQRGEHWRTAIQWINLHAAQGATIWIDPGLIEQTSATWPIEDENWNDYLTFVVRGTYQLRADLKFVATDANAFHHWQKDDHPHAWLLTRRTLPATVPRHRFGRTSVVQPILVDSEQSSGEGVDSVL